MQRLIAIAIACLSVLPIHAQTAQNQGDIQARDTIEVFVDNNKLIYLYHKVDSPVDQAQLAHFYGVPVPEILDASKLLRLEDSIDQSAYLVPLNTDMLQKEPCELADCIPVIYTVRPKETAFRIARRYFDLRIEQLRAINGMQSNDLAIGQQLLIGWFQPNLAPIDTSVNDSSAIAQEEELIPLNPFDPEIPEETVGLAFWNKSQSDQTNMFALHREARLYSEIEITNPMLKTRVLVRVIGRIPPTYTDDIAVIISPAVASKLGALDARFRAEMRFVK